MARWRLTEAHYLKVPGTKWEYTEVNRTTGRPVRKQFQVPMYLDPNDPSQWTSRNGPDAGEIVVCYENKGLPDDIVFEGGVTPGMLPLDSEAKEITKRMEEIWGTRVTQSTEEADQQASYTNQLLSGLIDQMTDLKTAAPPPQAVPGLEDFMKGMAEMMRQQTEILAKLANPVQSVRRI